MRRNIRNCRAIIITHGKAEAIIAESLKRSFRLPIEIFPGVENKNRSSIQLTSILTVLNNKELGSFSKFKSAKRFNTVKIGKKDIEDCKIFIILDTDDCINAGKPHLEQAFKTKEMFKGHWLYPHIIPIYNSPNLEHTMRCIGHNISHNVSDYQNYYGNIDPTNVESFWENEIKQLSKITSSNIDVLITYCMEWANNIKNEF